MPPKANLATWVRSDLGVRASQGLGKNGPLWTQAQRRVTHDRQILEPLDCDNCHTAAIHRSCLPGCGCETSATAISRPFSCTVRTLSELMGARSMINLVVFLLLLPQIPMLPYYRVQDTFLRTPDSRMVEASSEPDGSQLHLQSLEDSCLWGFRWLCDCDVDHPTPRTRPILWWQSHIG